jgi:ubiquinone/menaquinone biosynthesis C-methylase UbiE
VNGILAIKPLANLAKHQARTMMIKRAESIGVHWRREVEVLQSRGGTEDFSLEWEAELAQVQNLALTYPDYYLRPFHAYQEGNLGWQPAMEVEVAAHAVHARIWQGAGAKGDAQLRQSYHNALNSNLLAAPQDILDIGCSVGMSTFALQTVYPQARLTGVDLSPYFLAIAQYRSNQRKAGEQDNKGIGEQAHPKILPPLSPLPHTITWLHAPAESTGLPNASFNLVSAHLIFHELPRTAAVEILQEARRVLRPGGYLAIMDMNPKSEVYAKMPPYILTLLKSTEPYLDDYFTFNLEQAIYNAGFIQPTVICNSPRHRTLLAQVR